MERENDHIFKNTAVNIVNQYVQQIDFKFEGDLCLASTLFKDVTGVVDWLRLTTDEFGVPLGVVPPPASLAVAKESSSSDVLATAAATLFGSHSSSSSSSGNSS